MPIDLAGLIEERRGDKFQLFDRHLNAQLLRILRTLGFAVDYVRAEGPHLFDADGKRYLDLLSGFGVFALGRNHPTVTGALQQVLRGQLAGLVQFDVSLLAGLLAERLTGYMPWLPKLFFCNSGAEATEAAIKFSRAATGRSTILYCDHAFHGLTYGAVSLCGDEHFRARFGPFVGDCARIPFDDLEALEQALARRDVAAFVVEPIQGKGVNLPARRLSARGGPAVPRTWHPAGCRRDPDRHGANRALSGVGALGGRARPRAARQGAVRRLRPGRRGRLPARGVRPGVRPHGPGAWPTAPRSPRTISRWPPAWRR